MFMYVVFIDLLLIGGVFGPITCWAGVDCLLVVLSPRFNDGLCLVVGSNLGGDSFFTL